MNTCTFQYTRLLERASIADLGYSRLRIAYSFVHVVILLTVCRWASVWGNFIMIWNRSNGFSWQYIVVNPTDTNISGAKGPQFVHPYQKVRHSNLIVLGQMNDFSMRVSSLPSDTLSLLWLHSVCKYQVSYIVDTFSVLWMVWRHMSIKKMTWNADPGFCIAVDCALACSRDLMSSHLYPYEWMSGVSYFK